ncbi:hypothetical protein Tco_0649126 [Tanacetum coccineum]
MEKYYNAKVCNTSFKPGDLVYRNNDASNAEQGGKLGPKWEGPYEVTEVLGKGAYKLRGRDNKQLPRTWNIRNLKKCYVYKTTKHRSKKATYGRSIQILAKRHNYGLNQSREASRRAQPNKGSTATGSTNQGKHRSGLNQTKEAP